MNRTRLTGGRPGRRALASLSLAAGAALCAGPAYGQRIKGLDTSSAANGSAPSQALWNTAYAQGFEFAWVRSSRGGTSDATRLDDLQFYDNITRATTAGMLVGSYHFARPDAIATHTATDDANHYLERAGMYMKPGYLLPVFDLEDGDVEHSTTSLANWGIEFINRIQAVAGVVPIVYSNANYATNEVAATIAWHNVDANPATPHTDQRTHHWLARPGSNGLTGEPPPASGFPNPYGVWDPGFAGRFSGSTPISREPAVKPWAFWQQQLDHTPAGLFKIDTDYANGNMEFVKDFLVPALWTNAVSGDWGTISNWNSDNPGHVAGNLATGPAPRLPNNGLLDWVKLQNAGDGTVTISSGTRSVRKFYTQQQLDINAGSLVVNYVPGSGGKWDLPSEFNAVVNLASGANYTAHTTQVDGGGGQFNLNGGSVNLSEIQLASHATTPGTIVLNGNPAFTPLGLQGTAVIRSTGSLAQPGSISLSAGSQTLNVNDGTAAVDLNVRVGVGGAGRLHKSGLGTLQLSNPNTYAGGTTINAGVLQIAADDRLGAVPVGGIDSDNITLNGGTLRTGAQVNSVSLTNAGSGYTSFPTATVNGAGASAMPASVNVLAGISSIAVTSGGSGYVDQVPVAPPTANTAGTFVDIVGGGGTGAQAYATVVGGVVQSITITNPGTGYTSMPSIFISSTLPTGSSFAGTGAAANVSGVALQGMALNDGGFDYTNPTISLSGGGGTGATATATPTSNITLPVNRGIDLSFSGGTLFQTAGTTLTVNGTITAAGNGALTKDGPGTLTLNGSGSNYTGATVVNQGTLNATTPTSIGNNMGVLMVNNTNTGPGTNVVVNLSTTGPTTKGALAGTIATPSGGTNTATINNGGQMFTVNQLAFGTFPGVIAGTGGFTLGSISNATLTLSGANTYSGGTIINGGTLTAQGASALGATTNALQVNNPNTGPATSVVLNLSSTAPTTVGSLSGTIANASSGTNTATINLGSGQLFTVNQTTAGTFAGTIAGSGSFALGAGSTAALTLSGNNTYTGNTTVNGGILQFTSNGNLGSTSNTIILNGGTLRTLAGLTQTRNVNLAGPGGTIEVPLPGTFSGVISGTGNLTKGNVATLTLTNGNTYTGTTTISGGTLQVGNGGTTGSLASPSIANNAALSFNRSNDLTYGGNISGTGTLSKLDAGKLTLTGTNTYTGLTTVTAGTLQGNTASLPGNITNNAAVVFDQSTLGAYAGNMSGTGSLTKIGSDTLILSGANTYSGGTTVSAGTLQGTTSSLQGNITNNANVAFVQPTSGTYAGTITGTGSVVKGSGGTVAFTSNANSYTGGTQVHAGVLEVTRLHPNNSVTIIGGKLKVQDSAPTLPAHPAGDDAFVSRPSSLTIAHDGVVLGSRQYFGTLDLGNNDMIIDYGGTSPAAEIEDMIRSGYNVTGDWQGSGITSGVAAIDGNYVLAVADNASLPAPYGTANGGPLFAGVDVDLTSVLVKFTHRADINLDGVMTPDDSAIFGGNYEDGGPARWATGDMNYDGVFTPDDAALFGGAYDESLVSLPEPGTLGAVALSSLLLTARRRRASTLLPVS